MLYIIAINKQNYKQTKNNNTMKTIVTQKQGNSTLIVEFDFEKLIIKSHRNKEGEIFTYIDITYPSIEKMRNYRDFLINEHKFTML